MGTLTASVYTWFTAHVENCLAEAGGGAANIGTDDDCYVVGGAEPRVWVRIDREPYWSVEIFTAAATGLRPRTSVLRELNELNGRLASATATLRDGTVIIKQRLHADGVTANTVAQAINAVRGVAQDAGLLLTVMHDAQAAFVADVPAQPDA